MHDHTIDVTSGPAFNLTQVYKGRTTLTKLGFGASGQEFTLVKEQMDKFGDEFIDILKMDVEGAEFIHFKKLIEDFKLPDKQKMEIEFPVGQLQVEVHAKTQNAFKLLRDWFLLLESVGLRVFSSEPNLMTLFHPGNKGDERTGKPARIPFCEFAFLNSNLNPIYFL